MRWSLPVLRSLDGYRSGWFARDLTAGVLITAIAIPLSMGMAEVAGVPPIVGLYSCILPLVAYALLGSSRRLVIALDASTAAMLAAAVTPLARGDPVRYLAVATALTLMVGLMLVLAGTIRLGIVADLLSRPVLLGYQAGLAAVVISAQLEHLTGVRIGSDATMGRFVDAFRLAGDWSVPTVAIAVGSLVAIVGLRRWRPALPGPVIAVSAATLAVVAFHLGTDVAVVGSLPSGLPSLRVPALGVDDLWSLLGPAAAIALVAAADTLVTSRAFATRNGEDLDPSRDLIGLGAANVASAVSGGVTTSASAARTAVAESVGARSQVAGLVAAAAMVFVLAFFTRPLANVPRAALAAVVVFAVLRLVESANLRRLWSVRRVEFWIAFATFASVIAFGVLQAIVIAIGLSLLDVLRRTAVPADAVLGRVGDRHGFHDLDRHPGAVAPEPSVMIYRFDAPLFYGNAERFRSRVRRLVEERPQTRLLVVDAAGITTIDVTSADVLIELGRELGERGVTLVLADLVDDAKETLDRAGVFDVLGPGGSVDSIREALPRAEDEGPRTEVPG